MGTMSNEPVAIPRILKEIYQNVKRQNFLLRIAEAEKDLKAGKFKKFKVNNFIKQIDSSIRPKSKFCD
jgi:hypothetical protein